MGGLGSGRWRTRSEVDACRTLEIGALLDGAALQRARRGQLVWRPVGGGRLRAALTYAVVTERRPDGAEQEMLCLAYQPASDAPILRQELLLECNRAGRWAVLCPGFVCDGRAVRKLYAPPGEDCFLCRECHHLVYRRLPRAQTQAEEAAALGPLLCDELAALADRSRARSSAAARKQRAAALPAAVEDDRPLEAQELRLYALALRRSGLSLRAIAACLGSSKSSVARYCAAGRQGLDIRELLAERLARATGCPPSCGGGPPGISQHEELLLERRARRAARYDVLFQHDEEVVLTYESDEPTRLEALPNVGPLVAAKLRACGISAPADLVGRDPYALFDELCARSGHRHDLCLLDAFIAAVRFMEGAPKLPWWCYTPERKARLRRAGLQSDARPLSTRPR